MTTAKVVGVVDVGRGKVLSEKHRISFRFHDFENLPHQRGELVPCPSIACHGHMWSLELFPGGHMRSDESDVNVSVYLKRDDHPGSDTSDIEVTYALGVESAGHKTSGCNRHGNRLKFSKNARGFSNFAKRDDVLDGFLVDGTLTIDADIQVYTVKAERWVPPKRPKDKMLQMLESSEHADVTFVVDCKKFRAHRCVLALDAPLLLELTEDLGQDDKVQIDNVEPRIFEAFLHYVYSEELPSTVDLKEDAKVLLEVADKFGCSSLKLVAEAELAASGISVDTAAELLLLADSQNCALLKETAIDFFVANKDAVMASEGYSKVAESADLLNELMRAKPVTFVEDDTAVDSMRVATLRRKLSEMGNDIDGTREMLVKRLKTSSEHESD